MVRIKNRYLTIQVIPESESKSFPLKDYALFKCILDSVQKYYGDYGAGLVHQGLRVKYCNNSTRIAIVRCLHSAYKYISSILPLIVLVGDVRAKIRTIYIGATILHCNKFIIKYHQKYLDRKFGNTPIPLVEQFKSVLDFDMHS